MKKLVRLTENDLHRIIKESVNKLLKEEDGEMSERERIFQYIKTTEESINKKLSVAIGNRYGIRFDVITQVFPRSESMYIMLIPLDDSLNFLNISAKDVVSRVIAKHGYIVTKQSYQEAPAKYGTKKGCICYMCKKDDDALTFMPRPGIKRVNKISRNTYNDGDNINLNSPNSGEALRRGYTGNEWGSSSAMENPWGPNGIGSLRSMYGGRRRW